MIDWNQLQRDVNRTVLETFGDAEKITLPSGQVDGIFSENPAEIGISSEEGLLMKISQQPRPIVIVDESDAAELVEQDAIRARGRDFLLSRKDQDGHGFVVLRLMPADAGDIATPPAGSRWR